MDKGPNLVTVSYPAHHRVLSTGLWNLYQTRQGLDVELRCGEKSIRAHWLLAEIFLNTQDHDHIVRVGATNVDVDVHDGEGKQSGADAELELLLEFLYRGTVTLTEERMDGLVAAAKELNFQLLVDATEVAKRRLANRMAAAERRCGKAKSSRVLSTTRSTDGGTSPIDQTQSPTLEPSVMPAPKMKTYLKADRLRKVVAELDIENSVAAIPTKDKTEPETVEQAKPIVLVPQLTVFHAKSLRSRATSGATGNQVSVGEVPVQDSGINPDGNPVSSQLDSDTTFAKKGDSGHGTSEGNPNDKSRTPLRRGLKRRVTRPSNSAKRRKTDDNRPASKLLKCQSCEVTCTSETWLKIHSAKHDPSIPVFKCHHCSRKFSREDTLQRHKKSLHSVLFKCGQCDFASRCRIRIGRHRSSHVTTKIIPSTFVSCELTLSEETRPSTGNPDAEDQVGPVNVGLQDTSMHDNVPTKRRRKASDILTALQCKSCDFKCASERWLKIHAAKHDPTIPVFTCYHCSRKFSKEDTLQRHKKSLHSVLFDCDNCDFKSRCRIRICRHRRSHGSKTNLTELVSIGLKSGTDGLDANVGSRVTRLCKGSDTNDRVGSGSKSEEQPTTSLQCDQCDYKTFDKICFKIHAAKHDQSITVYKCKHCAAKFVDESAFSRHTESLHSELFSCGDCEFQSRCKIRITRHRLIHDPNARQAIIRCQYCRYVFLTQKALERHIEKHKKFCCRKCDFTTLRRNEMREHVCDVTSQVVGNPEDGASELPPKRRKSVLRCVHCDFKTLYQATMRLHAAKHDASIVLFKCEYCSRKFLSEAKRESHSKIQHSKVYDCRHCTYTTRIKDRYNHHRLSHDAELKATRLRCDLCRYPFLTQEALDQHKINHPTYKCTLCDYVTEKRARLGQHRSTVHSVFTRSDEKLPVHQCDQCKFSSTKRSQLNYHVLAVHTGFKPFSCPMADCNYRTGRKPEVNRHVKTHHLDIKPYTCEICGYRNSSQSALKLHVNSHAGLKLFKCSECNLSLATKRGLKNHARLHSNDARSHVCHQCGRGFHRATHLKVHLKNVHKDPELCET